MVFWLSYHITLLLIIGENEFEIWPGFVLRTQKTLISEVPLHTKVFKKCSSMANLTGRL